MSDTLEDAKQFLRDNWEDGVACPCCKQMVKLYKRRLYATIAVNLIRLYKLDRGEYHHMSKILLPNSTGGGDFAKLQYWGLIEEEPVSSAKKRTSGMWKITARGIAFVEGRLSVQSHVQLYNGNPYGLTGDDVNIKDVLGKRFDYQELMA